MPDDIKLVCAACNYKYVREYNEYGDAVVKIGKGFIIVSEDIGIYACPKCLTVRLG